MQDNTISWWLNYFRPNSCLRSINELNVMALRRQGVKWVFCDLDNTLAPHFTRVPNKDALAFRNKLVALQMKLVVVSNNKKSRVENFCKVLQPHAWLANCKKPIKRKIKNYMHANGIVPQECLFVGDQFITDTLVANRLKCRSVLVLPLFEAAPGDYANSLIGLLDRYVYQKLSQKNMINVSGEPESGLEEIYEIL